MKLTGLVYLFLNYIRVLTSENNNGSTVWRLSSEVFAVVAGKSMDFAVGSLGGQAGRQAGPPHWLCDLCGCEACVPKAHTWADLMGTAY